MLSGQTGAKLSALMTTLKGALSTEINDSVLDSKGMYANVQVQGDVAKSLAREAYNLFVSVEAFFAYINVPANGALLGRKELNDYIQEPGNKLVDNIKKALKEKAKLSQQEKDQIHVLIKAAKPLLDFAFDSAKKSVRTDVINQLIADIQASPAIAAKGWMERSALTVALGVAKGTSLPAFLVDLAATMATLEKETIPQVVVVAQKPQQAVSSNAVSSNAIVLDDDSSMEYFDDSSSEEQANTFADVAKHLESVNEKQSALAHSLASKSVTTFTQVKQAESDNALIMARVNSLSDALTKIHEKDKTALEVKKTNHKQNLDDAGASEVKLRNEITDLNDLIEKATLASDKLVSLQTAYQSITQNITSTYYFGTHRNDVAEAINAKLNVDFKIEDLDINLKVKFDAKFKDLTSWTYDLRMEFEAVLKQEIERIQKGLKQQQVDLNALSAKLAKDVVKIKKEEEKLASLALDLKQLNLDAEKEYLKIHKILTRASDLQVRLSRDKDRINYAIQSVVADCKEEIKTYKQERHKVYGAQDFFGSLVEKMAKPVNGTFKSIKTQRYEYFDELNDALDDLSKMPEDPKLLKAIIDLLKKGADTERFKPRQGSEQNDKVYLKTFQACIESISRAVNSLLGLNSPVTSSAQREESKEKKESSSAKI